MFNLKSKLFIRNCQGISFICFLFCVFSASADNKLSDNKINYLSKKGGYFSTVAAQNSGLINEAVSRKVKRDIKRGDAKGPKDAGKADSYSNYVAYSGPKNVAEAPGIDDKHKETILEDSDKNIDFFQKAKETYNSALKDTGFKDWNSYTDYYNSETAYFNALNYRISALEAQEKGATAQRDVYVAKYNNEAKSFNGYSKSRGNNSLPVLSTENTVPGKSEEAKADFNNYNSKFYIPLTEKYKKVDLLKYEYENAEAEYNEALTFQK